MINITFISVHIKRSPLSFPLSSAILAAAVDADSVIGSIFKTDILDLFLEMDLRNSAFLILESQADIAAFSIYIWNRDYILQLIKELKILKPDISVIAGGAEVTADPEFFYNVPDIDWIVNGEGEEALIEYLSQQYSQNALKDNSSDDFPGDVNKTPGLQNKTSNIFQRRSVSDLEYFPSPILTKKINLSGYDGILWELSRGCPFKCAFCFESRGGEKVRKFSLMRIENELDLIISSGINQVFVLDPTFNIDRERAVKILKLIKEKASDIHFTFEARSEYIDYETAALFSEISCSIQIGLQSSNLNVLKNVNRTMDIEDFYNKVILLDEAGAVYGFDIIYGLPGDSLKYFLESLDFALDMAPNHLDIFPLAILKGTELYEKTDQFRLEYKKTEPYTIIATPDFSSEEINYASGISEAVDIFYNRGKAVSFLPLILENTEISPSQFFTILFEWVNNNFKKDYSKYIKEPDISSFQMQFVRYLFSEYEMIKEGILASDIISSIKDEESVSGDYNMEMVISYLESGVTSLTELVFFTTINR